MAARLLIGYGAGKATLDVVTTLMRPDGTKLLVFKTDSTTGAMPGAGLGIASAAGTTATALRMIGPALGVPGTLRQGLGQEIRQTAAKIDQRLGSYFIRQGWSYPDPAGGSG